ncbi:hypothetical protein Desde_3158 [Desulfitobacterium dehalogenans ATCC 51507]|uniref:Uncharacterized protein n=1 Tax=Desulfitobacterium dehalogenans (strain ATCC 51507 / DSM 9161 / JW/IU-DC1) TaxID=756499 RepID=I4ABW4_DESDJ|nr:hypothetical protein [Desulfitobacterium dehalogenans]AFM01449.1 hypothetical protein Desde_3158 [Desulfitobacterium dehalogenans ATCC 51507]
MNYDKIVTDFTQTWYEELFRRLRCVGYDIRIINDNYTYANIYWEDALVCQIDNNNDLKGDWSSKAVKIIAEETAEYVLMYKMSPPIKSSNSGKQLRGYRKLLAYNDQVLAARLTPGEGYQFATGYRSLTLNYYVLDKRFSDYSKACEDFALRARLIDHEKLFNESELKVIRSGLTRLITISPPQVTFEELKDIGNVLNKISFILVPRVQTRELEELEL